MSNMSHCRFENTFNDLQDCYDKLTEEGVQELEANANKYEKKYIRKLIELCRDIVDDFGDIEDDDE